MLKVVETHRKHEFVTFLSDEEGLIRMDLLVHETLLPTLHGGRFNVVQAIFEHPNGILHRTFVNTSDTSNRATLEDLISNWFRPIVALPQSYHALVEWIESCPDHE
jgi:hypothetical protein